MRLPVKKVERIQFSVEGERLDYYFISGKTPMGTVEKYTELTGKPRFLRHGLLGCG